MQSCASGEGVLVDDEERGMSTMGGAKRLIPDPNEEELGGHYLRVEGEVLCPHHRLHYLVGPWPQHVHGHLPNMFF